MARFSLSSRRRTRSTCCPIRCCDSCCGWRRTPVYRIRVEGRENIPERGGALFVCNHMSFVDALPADRVDRPADTLPDVQGHLRPAVRKAVREADAARFRFPPSCGRAKCCTRCARRATPSARAKSSASSPKGRSRASARCFPSAAAWSASSRASTRPSFRSISTACGAASSASSAGVSSGSCRASIPYPVTVSFGKPMPPTATPFEVRRAVQAVADRGVRSPQEASAHAAPLADSHGAPPSLSASRWETGGARA